MQEHFQQVEFKENNNLMGRRVLVTGARSSIGRDVVGGVLASGGEVIMGGRNQRSYQFAVDLSNRGEVDQGMNFILDNSPPTDIVLSAAAGLESILTLDLTRGIVQYSKANGDEREKRRQSLEEMIRSRIERGYNDALQVNSLSNKQIIHSLRENRIKLPDAVRVIYLSSFWSDLYGKINVPLLYRLVAETKHDFLEFLDRESEQLAQEGIYTAIVSGHLIPETATGGQLMKLGKKLPDIIRFSDAFAFPKVRDMSAQVIELLTQDPTRWQTYPNRKYITGEGKVEDTMDKLHPALASVQITL